MTACVILIVDAPLSSRDRDRFGVDHLRALGLPVEVWAVHRIFQPRHDHVEPDVKGLTYLDLSSDAELAMALDGLPEDSVVVSLCGMLVGQESQYARLRELLALSGARLGAVSAGTRPPRSSRIAAPRTGARIARAWSEVASGRMSPGDALRRARAVAAAGVGGNTTRPRPGTRALDWAWTGPAADVIDARLIGPATQVRALHTWDYDSELRKPVQRGPRAGIVYLESMGPLHPDFKVLGMRPYVSPEEWFSYVAGELAAIEGVVGEPVTIAAHPRAGKGELDDWYSGFRVVHDRTRELVAQARLVLAAEPSTALGLCAMYDTPALLLQPSRAFPDHLEDLAAYEEAMGLTTVSGRDFPAMWEEAARPGLERAGFRSLCIRSPQAPDRPFWQTVADDICA